jgi:hypothetical protein
MGRRTLNTAWRDIARWLRRPDAAKARPRLPTPAEASNRGEETAVDKNGVGKVGRASIAKPHRKRRPCRLMKIGYIAEDFDLTNESIIRDFEGSD